MRVGNTSLDACLARLLRRQEREEVGCYSFLFH